MVAFPLSPVSAKGGLTACGDTYLLSFGEPPPPNKKKRLSFRFPLKPSPRNRESRNHQLQERTPPSQLTTSKRRPRRPRPRRRRRRRQAGGWGTWAAWRWPSSRPSLPASGAWRRGRGVGGEGGEAAWLCGGCSRKRSRSLYCSAGCRRLARLCSRSTKCRKVA